jgi:hypothetical protein
MPMQSKGTFGSLSLARRKMDECIKERTKKGYVDVDSDHYQLHVPLDQRVTLQQLLERVDTSRIVGASPTVQVTSSDDASSMIKKVTDAIEVGSSISFTKKKVAAPRPPPQKSGPARAHRSLNI